MLDVESRIERTPTECWLWTGYINASGYGKVGVRRKYYLAHRLVYAQLRGPIPTGLQLDHLCRVRRCMNPDHLRPVTMQENLHAPGSHYNGMRTHCKNGHPFDEANTYIVHGRGRTSRSCRACNAAAQRRRQMRLRERS